MSHSIPDRDHRGCFDRDARWSKPCRCGDCVKRTVDRLERQARGGFRVFGHVCSLEYAGLGDRRSEVQILSARQLRRPGISAISAGCRPRSVKRDNHGTVPVGFPSKESSHGIGQRDDDILDSVLLPYGGTNFPVGITVDDLGRARHGGGSLSDGPTHVAGL